MVRTILTPEKTHIELDIPPEYLGKQIEITCLSLDEIKQPAAEKKMADFWAILSDESSNALRENLKHSRME